MAPHAKKGLKMGAKLGFWDESGISDRPTVRRSWAPKGKTPVIRSTGSWKTYALVGVLTCTPRGGNPKAYLRMFSRSVHADEVIQSIKHLRRHVRGKLILLWDGLAAHRAKVTEAFLKTQRHWLTVRRLPPYAPELNPVEYGWSSGKRRELANFSPDRKEAMRKQVRKCARRFQRHPETLKGFLRASGLFT